MIYANFKPSKKNSEYILTPERRQNFQDLLKYIIQYNEQYKRKRIARLKLKKELHALKQASRNQK